MKSSWTDKHFMASRRVGLAVVACGLWAAAWPVHAEDGKDHPLLSRVAGTALLSQAVQQFGVVTPSVAGALTKGTPTSFEGRVTRTDYGVLEGTPPGEVKIYRSYLAAVKRLGGQALNNGIDFNDPNALVTGAHIFSLSAAPKPPIAVLNITNAYNYQLTVIEPEAMQEAVTAGQLAEKIKATGVATLHINFDTNKSDLKADGQAAVKQISELLKADPSLRLTIEGHTDNVGSAAANKGLSDARAKAVMAAVVASGVDAKRLSAAGFGSERPVADNRSEEGRAKNRRVDLVKVK